MLPGDSQDRLHVSCLAKEVHRYNGLRPRGDRLFQQGRAHGIALFIHVHENRGSAAETDRLYRSKEGVWNGNDLIAPADAERQESEPESFRTASYTDCEFALAERGEPLFEQFDKRPT